MSNSRPKSKKTKKSRFCCKPAQPSTYAMKTKFKFSLGGCGEIEKKQADINREANLSISGGIIGLLSGISTSFYYLNSCDHTSTGGAYPSTVFCYVIASYLFLRAYTLQKKGRECALKLVDKFNDSKTQPLLTATNKPLGILHNKEFKLSTRQIEGVPTIARLPETSEGEGFETPPGYVRLDIKSPKAK